MGARADHHVSLRVNDIERSIRFWQEALGGRLVVAPVERSGPYIEAVFGEGTRVKVCHVAFEANAVELWEFLEPRTPLPPADQRAVGQMHFGVTVDDVPATLARVEAAGGRARFPIKKLAGNSAASFVYCEDVDGHVFELLDADHPETARLLIAASPDADPAGRERA
jgi:catechol 2,3-dioxygenase-like lactoylglutathione lyase family enzyme